MSDSSWSCLFPLWPPSTNSIWRYGKRVHLAPAAVCFRDAVRIVMGEARAKGFMPRESLRGKLGVKLVFHQPNKQRRDLDNLLKATLDALTKAGLWQDDSQIERLDVSHGEPDPQKLGSFWLRVEEL